MYVWWIWFSNSDRQSVLLVAILQTLRERGSIFHTHTHTHTHPHGHAHPHAHTHTHTPTHTCTHTQLLYARESHQVFVYTTCYTQHFNYYTPSNIIVQYVMTEAYKEMELNYILYNALYYYVWWFIWCASCI